MRNDSTAENGEHLKNLLEGIEMFEQLDEKMGKSRLRWTVWLAMLLMAGLVGSMVLVQNFWPQTFKSAVMLAKETLIAPVVPKVAPAAPAAEPPKQKVSRQFVPPTRVFHGPTAVPPKITLEPESLGDAPTFVSVCTACVPGGIPGDVGELSLVALPVPPSSVPLPKEQSTKPAAPKQVRVGGDVQIANLLRRVTPAYPPLAKAAHVEGVVKFTAVISKDGSIQQLHLIGGPPLLVQAATLAVSQWAYRPTLLNGEPVEVVTEIEVRFTLSR